MGSYLSKSTRLNEKNNINVLLLGLSNAGKTTICLNIENKLRFNIDFKTTQTFWMNTAYITHYKYRLTFWDLAGHDNMNNLWKTLFDNEADSVVYVIDLCDEAKHEEALDVLKKHILKCLSGSIKSLVIVYNVKQEKETNEKLRNSLTEKILTLFQETHAYRKIRDVHTIEMNAKKTKAAYIKMFNTIVREYENNLLDPIPEFDIENESDYMLL